MNYAQQSLLNTCIEEIRQLKARLEAAEKQIAAIMKGKEQHGN